MKVDERTSYMFLGEGNPGERIHTRIESFGKEMWQKRDLITVKVNFFDGSSYGIYVLEKAQDGELELRGTRISDEFEANVPIKYQAALRGAKMAAGSDIEGSEVAEYQFEIDAINQNNQDG